MMMRDSATQLGEGDVLDPPAPPTELTYPPQTPATGTRGHKAPPRAALAAPANSCGAPTAKGSRCTTPKLSGHPSGLCRMHAAVEDPALAAQLALERVQGGKTGRMSLALRQLGLELQPDFASPEGVTHAMEITAHAVARGSITASQAGAISQLAGVALRAAEARVDRDLRDLEARIEQKIEQRARR